MQSPLRESTTGRDVAPPVQDGFRGGTAGHLTWIAGDAWRRFRGRIITLLALNLLGTAMGAAAILGLIGYARALESRAPLRVGGIVLEVSRDAGSVLSFAVALLAAGLISAGCVYAAHWLISRISVDYLRANTQRLLEIAGDPACRGWGALVAGRPETAMLNLAGREARAAAIVLRYALLMLLPVLVLALALFALFTISAPLTLLLLPMALAYLVPLRRITRGVAEHQAELLRANRAARARLRADLAALRAGSAPPAAQIARAINSPEVMHANQTLFRRRLAGDRMHLVNTGFFLLCVFVLFAWFAIQASRSGHSWAELLLYVIALRFAVTELRRATALLVLINRYVPLYQPYRAFVDGAESLRRDHARSAPAELPERLTFLIAGHLWESPAQVCVKRGEIVWVVLPWKPTRGDLESAAMRLQMALETPMNLQTSVEFAEPGAVTRQTPEILMGEREDRATVTTIPPPTATQHLTLLAARDLKDCDEETAVEFVTRRLGGYVVIVTHDPRATLDLTFKRLRDRMGAVLIVRDGEIAAGGDMAWFAPRLGEIRADLRRRRATLADEDEEAMAE